MWNQNISEEQSSKIVSGSENSNLIDSGFSSWISEEQSMRGSSSSSDELDESLLRNLKLKYSNVSRIVENKAKKSKISRNYESSDIFKLPHEHFFRQDDDGDTQLHISIASKYVEASLYLIDIALDASILDIMNDSSQTALHIAVMSHQAKIVRRLILAGANPKIRTFTGNTPLHLACNMGDLDCVKALTEPLTDEEIHWISKTGAKGFMTELTQYLELRNYIGQTCLHIAASKGYFDLVHYLLQIGAQSDAQEGLAGKTVLHLAVEKNNRQLVRFMANNYKSSLDITTYAGLTAYQISLGVNRRLSRDLLRAGASRRIYNNNSDSGTEDSETEFIANQVKNFSRMSIGCNATAITA